MSNGIKHLPAMSGAIVVDSHSSTDGSGFNCLFGASHGLSEVNVKAMPYKERVFRSWLARSNPRLAQSIVSATEDVTVMMFCPQHIGVGSGFSEARSRGFDYSLDEITRPIVYICAKRDSSFENAQKTRTNDKVSELRRAEEFAEWDPLKFEIRMAIRDYFEAENADPDCVQ